MKLKWVLLMAIVLIPIIISISPFWVVFPLSFIIGLLLKKEYSSTYLFLFLLVFFFFFYGIQAYNINQQNEGILASRIAVTMSVPSILPWMSGLIIGLCIAVFAWSGALLRKTGIERIRSKK